MLYGSLIVRAVLVRKEDTYRHFGVDVICENHKNDVGVESTDHVLHPASGMEASSYFDSDSGERQDGETVAKVCQSPRLLSDNYHLPARTLLLFVICVNINKISGLNIVYDRYVCFVLS